MKTYDWIVIGAGFTGAALAYELVRTGFSVLLLEQDASLRNATNYSYGGLAFWSGTTPLTRQLYDEGIARYRLLAQELETDIEFRELDLLLTIASDSDPEVAAASYSHFAIPPKLLSVDEAWEMEPLLNKEAIAGALTVKHGHLNPEKTAQAYIQAFLRLGGEMEITQVQNFTSNNSSPTIKTTTKTYHSANVVVCAGGFSRQLLKAAGIPIRLYFTHAEMIQTPPVEVQLRTLVMPANLQRFQLEAESSKVDELWNEPGNELAAPILDAGAIQFQDRSIRLGQISRLLTDVNAEIDRKVSESWLRRSIGEILPALSNLPGTWHHCLVAFSSDRLPVIGAIPEYRGIYVFSGFSNPLVIVPPLAQRFANYLTGKEDEIISQLSPVRL
ncbi:MULTISPECIES: NAD(P)/FAD-dependent oxidoreductase [Fischerella]|uniref:FAD-binding oxidoreductase n=1 Tax=Fischerella muscicola CCMEE 5323 TaxID=2019572 RepID=A0A2N6K5H4_FISMU|nr:MULTISPECIES: FAD-binding oxidoreductase [Fischerella]MBD2433903.1 FAD-binding oxidoreductase [Fischerella sp. FACHB-380]PLZ91800.1 FAD-binding oxidoreductase [Fischerella muscicola CCMEE 5323]